MDGFYDIRGVGEITTIDDFKEAAFANSERSGLQSVIALKKNMSGRSWEKLKCSDCLRFKERPSDSRLRCYRKSNLIPAGVRVAGGPGAAATICGVSRQTFYDWTNVRRV